MTTRRTVLWSAGAGYAISLATWALAFRTEISQLPVIGPVVFYSIYPGFIVAALTVGIHGGDPAFSLWLLGTNFVVYSALVFIGLQLWRAKRHKSSPARM